MTLVLSFDLADSEWVPSEAVQLFDQTDGWQVWPFAITLEGFVVHADLLGERFHGALARCHQFSDNHWQFLQNIAVTHTSLVEQ